MPTPRGVIHRDLKPQNIVVGEFGEVVVIDWGLAKTRERPDLARSVWQERIDEYREAADLQTVASALGTPGYMAPEAAFGESSLVDERSDVYSLGAILHRILTGKLPFEFTDALEWMAGLADDAARRASDIDPAIPGDLSRICAKALARAKADRYAEAGELADAIRAWQRRHAVEGEVAALSRDAETAFAATEGLTGEDLLRQLDRVTAVTSRILELRPAHEVATDLVRRSEAAREQAIGEREKAAKSHLLKRIAAAALVVGLVLAGVVIFLIDAERDRANEERDAKQVALAETTRERNRANRERDSKETALIEVTRQRDAVLRLADSKKVRDLVTEVDDLWPLHPDTVQAMEAWIARAKAVIAKRQDHADALAATRCQARPYTEAERVRDHAAEIARLEKSREGLPVTRKDIEALDEDESEEAIAKRETLEERVAALEEAIETLSRRVEDRASWTFSDATMAWKHEVLHDLLSGIATLADGDDARLGRIEARLAFSESLAPALSGRDRGAWASTVAAIADRARNPQYEGLRIQPVLGLIPLGQDPRSKLFEFAHMGSGSVPTRDPETGKLVQEEDAAIVLVLIPGGAFLMGAQAADPEKPNFDPQADDDESPVHEVKLNAYFIAKYECTQAQWAAVTEAERSDAHGPSRVIGTDRYPVKMVTWEDATQWLGRHRLVLPSEARWEHACRAGTGTPWFTGREVAALSSVTNIADACLKAHQGDAIYDYTEEVNDGHVLFAPVGSLAPNWFGLHDVHGNVHEWCENQYRTYASVPADSTAPTQSSSGMRVTRGGSWILPAEFCRSARRDRRGQSDRTHFLGFRPAADLPE